MSSETWVALLRGINVGSAKRVAMADLRALLSSLGYEDVRTHLQSGNAVFRARRATTLGLEKTVSDRIKADLGLDVRVLARSAEELDAVVGANPFAGGPGDPKELHVAFLSSWPQAAKVKAIDPDQLLPDELAFGDRVVYLRLPKGVMGSTVPDWGRALGVTVTQRNWNTVTRLHEMAAG